jgi:hypothetical protein
LETTTVTIPIPETARGTNSVAGRIDWDAQNFTLTAQKVTFGFEGASNVPVLRAELRNEAGVYVPTDKNLGERIQNREGVFTYVP